MVTDNMETKLYSIVTRLSFTGTRDGMTEEQKRVFKWLLKQMPVKIVVHGDCTGADVDAHEISINKGLEIWKYPSTHYSRAYTHGGILKQEPRPPLDRNRDIVNAGQGLAACPKGMTEELRSGTWAAIRYARKVDKLIWTLWPDGSITCPWDV